MVTRDQINQYLAEFLQISDFEDMCPNGLQVEGKSEINHVVSGVSASVELFENAVRLNADAILVHHGIIWNFNRPLYTGGYRERVRLLLENNLNLFAYHLPLDAHHEVGNNSQIGKLLNLQKMQPFGNYRGHYIGTRGEIKPLAAEDFFRKVEEIVNQKILIFPYGSETINQVGIISGGAQKEVTQAVSAGLDVYITGEVSEHNMHYAKEEHIHFISAGHYATEKFGILALGKHLMNKFRVKVSFIDVPNPV